MAAIKPNTYGDVMAPLDPAKLPKDLLLQLSSNPELKRWADLSLRTMRAEKISSWMDWTAEESAAYARGDQVAFSRLRGYSEEEIREWCEFQKLTKTLIDSMGEEDVTSIHHALMEACSTPAMDAVNDALISRMGI